LNSNFKKIAPCYDKHIYRERNYSICKRPAKSIGENYKIRTLLQDFTKKLYPPATEEWNFSGIKYGWSFRIRDKKRVIVYLLPRDNFFKVALVFGQKATDEILE